MHKMYCYDPLSRLRRKKNCAKRKTMPITPQEHSRRNENNLECDDDGTLVKGLEQGLEKYRVSGPLLKRML